METVKAKSTNLHAVGPAAVDSSVIGAATDSLPNSKIAVCTVVAVDLVADLSVDLAVDHAVDLAADNLVPVELADNLVDAAA